MINLAGKPYMPTSRETIKELMKSELFHVYTVKDRIIMWDIIQKEVKK